MKILLTGVSGLLGSNLAWYFRDKAEVTGVFNTHPVAMSGVEMLSLNLEDYPRTRQVITGINPDVVIHCASRTDVDNQETDQEGSWRANVLVTRILLDSLRDRNTHFVHISTDSIYPGIKGPYKESDTAGPCNGYGRTKLEAERLVAARPGSLVLRTNIFGWNIRDKESISEWFLNNLQNGKQISGFTDAIFSSIYTRHFAEILDQCLIRQVSGLFNLSCRNALTKNDFGKTLADIFGFDAQLVQPQSLDQAALPAQRGRDLSLDISKLETVLQDCRMPTIQEGLKAFHQDWLQGVPKQIKESLNKTISGNVLPPRQTIPYGCQFIDNADIASVQDVLHSWNLTQGPTIDHFERNVAALVGAKFGIAVSSGTSALHIACLVSGVSPGDEVITSPITFVASANCAVYCGATPIFVDIDPLTYNMNPDALEKKIGVKTRAVIPVHFAGQSCDMVRIHAIVRQKEAEFGHKIFIIEDACHALGSEYRNHPVGNNHFSDMTVFSFHPVKHITTGEGGIVVTNDASFDKRLRVLRSHGISRNTTNTSPGPWYYEQIELGFNYRITDIQCALGNSQLKKLPWFQKRRREIVDRYNQAFRNLPCVTAPHEMPECDSNFHIYVLQFDFDQLGQSRTEIMHILKSHGVLTQVHYIPVYSHPFYRNHFPVAKEEFPNSEHFYESSLSIPLFPGMTDREIDQVIDRVTALAKR